MLKQENKFDQIYNVTLALLGIMQHGVRVKCERIQVSTWKKKKSIFPLANSICYILLFLIQ